MKIHFNRRILLAAAGAAALLLAGCGGETPPTVLAVTAQGSAGMNPGPDGVDRPVTVNVLQLSGTGAFDAADYLALQDPATALGSDLVKADQIVLAPGATVVRSVPVQAGVTAIGVTAGFRDPTGRTVRQKIPVPAASSPVTISVGSGGLSVSGG
ncbi:type VI secretion system lipoprotein TssJ [Paracoccus marinaquae]|uniref:Type VI secretion system lipoprotein TssJ n=1 Tax=Paracoccus marinaquae TaxID=2841926 RepID=A0ABS6APW3_9RHOB|nr:type VI secretion system lipoprotein TssJ [Paracoccus marinaquae]MBU3031506.1 type VI secretion system lipoprotein TssJ [Paracoccus marinaquae]